jgi:methionyl-tRNA synthetase
MEGIVDFADWQKLDLRVGEIIKVEDIEGADKLYKISVDIGEETKTVCAGLKNYYSKTDLKGKKIILFTNLTPRKLKGIESNGMILAAVNKEETEVVLLTPDSDIEVGSKVR